MMSLPAQVGNAVRYWRSYLTCSYPGCRSSKRMWTRVSNGVGSISLHGNRYCFPGCFEKELLHRFEDMRPHIQTATPHRVPLGLLMLSRGDLNRDQLRQALAAQRRSGVGRIGEWIERLGFAPEAQVTAAVAAQWGCPVLKILPDASVDSAIPFPLLRRFCMAPVHYVNATRVMHIAFAGSIEYRALLAIEQMLQCRAEPCMTSPTALAHALARVEEDNNRRSYLFEDVCRREDMMRITSSYAARLGAEDVRLTACGEYVWVRLDAGTESSNLLFSLPPGQLRSRWQAAPYSHRAIKTRN